MINLLKVSYDRIVGKNRIELTDSNYENYNFLKDDKGYYQKDENGDKVYTTYTEENITQSFSHILPNPSSFFTTYSDVDKEGSGRNETTGQMERERIGHYCSLDVTWDIIPNSKERINLVKILRNLPIEFKLTYKDSDIEASSSVTKTFYRADISEDLYMFLEDNQIWKGLSTSFIQFDVESYDDGKEPELIEVD